MNLVIGAMVNRQLASKHLLGRLPRGAPNAPKRRFEKLHDLPVNYFEMGNIRAMQFIGHSAERLLEWKRVNASKLQRVLQ